MAAIELARPAAQLHSGVVHAVLIGGDHHHSCRRCCRRRRSCRRRRRRYCRAILLPIKQRCGILLLGAGRAVYLGSQQTGADTTSGRTTDDEQWVNRPSTRIAVHIGCTLPTLLWPIREARQT